MLQAIKNGIYGLFTAAGFVSALMTVTLVAISLPNRANAAVSCATTSHGNLAAANPIIARIGHTEDNEIRYELERDAYHMMEKCAPSVSNVYRSDYLLDEVLILQVLHGTAGASGHFTDQDKYADLYIAGLFTLIRDPGTPKRILKGLSWTLISPYYAERKR